MRIRSALRGTAATATFLALTMALSELAAVVLLHCSSTGLPARSEIQATLDLPESPAVDLRHRGDPRPAEFMRQHVLHPYLGFVRNPDVGRQVFNSRVVEEPVNPQGFFGPSPLEAVDAETFTLALTGGSVATDLYLRSSEKLREELQTTPSLADKRIRILCLALGGMKQPQQLMALQYFLSLGASFDAVVNLDGFNEIALPFAENVPAGLPISAPRSWQLYTARIADDRSALLLAAMSEKRRQIERMRSLFSRDPFRRSSVCLILWNAVHGKLRGELLALEKRMRDRLRRAQPGDGAPSPRPLEAVLAEATELWTRSSLQMWKTCLSNDCLYLHALQPNRYLEGSKPLDARERRMSWPPDFAYRRAAEQGYPLLISAGKELRRLGVPFYDLTRIFESETEGIYVDPCCHYSQRGNDMLAARIAGLVAASIEAREVSSPSPGRGTAHDFVRGVP